MELTLNTREAADIWLALHKTRHEDLEPDMPDPLDPMRGAEEELYRLLTDRMIEGARRPF